MHSFQVRVYYEDTDLAGIVYYANYLRFIERGRSEWLRELGIDQVALKAEGLVFAVRRVEADYLQPAKYDDLLEVRSSLRTQSPARMVLHQEVRRGEVLLFAADVTLVAIGEDGRPRRLPAALVTRMAAAVEAPQGRENR